MEQSDACAAATKNPDSNGYDEAFIGQLESSFRNSISIPKRERNNSEDAPTKDTLINWMVSKAEIDPTQAAEYADVFLMHGLKDEIKLAKRVKRNDQAIELLGIPRPDALSIIAALRRSKLLEARVVSLRRVTAIQNEETNAQPVPSNTLPASGSTPSVSTTHDFVTQISARMQRVIEANDATEAEGAAKEVCREIIDVAGDNADIQEALGQRGICEDLVSLLTIYTSSSDRVVQNALCAMSVLCRRKVHDKSTQCLSNIKKLGEVRACQCTIAAIRRYDDNVLIIKWATSCIRNLCSLEANRVFFSYSGACLALLQVVHKFKTNDDVIRWIFRSLGKLSATHDNRMSLVHNGFCEFIMEVMDLHQQNSLVIADSCWVLRTLASDDSTCRAKLVQLRACELVCRAMLDHYLLDVVVVEAARAIQSLTKDSEDAINRLMTNDTMKVLVLPLLGTTDSTQFASFIQTNCCNESSAVACLSAVYAISTTERVRTALFDCGAVQAIVSALNHHPQSPDVAIWSCKCIHRLSSSPIAQKKTRTSNVCEALVQLLQRDVARTDPLTAEWAGLAVSIVAIDKVNRSTLDACGACAALTSALSYHEHNPDVAYRMCGAIHFMSLDDDCRTKLGELGACSVVTEILKYHTDCAAVLPSLVNFHEGAVQASARAVGSLAFEHQENCLRLVSCGACDVIMSSARVFHGSIAMTEFCCRAISRLCACEDSCRGFGERGVFACILSALRLYPHSEAVVKHGFFALHALTNQEVCPNAAADNVTRLFSETSSLEVILSVLEIHAGSNIETAQFGCIMMSRLVGGDLFPHGGGSSEQRTLDARLSKYACRVLLSCLKANPTEDVIHANGIRCIVYLNKQLDDDMALFLCEAGFTDVLVSSLRHFARNSSIVLACLMGATDLSNGLEKRNVFCTMSACEAIIGSLTSLHNDADVAR